ncbi:thiolase family protein [Hoeflea sp. WL0058]|uniref:Thiolase family protein n=1 Tax=Flavimaribacter sediminis TaxID=2865987 RepID=A0AAE2ZMJ3_9HYPH|nr:thiolase family protein [Flavimaribacter sediminis]MBW8638714.1 thiolase family protein [Flavimaribacter sediminis]
MRGQVVIAGIGQTEFGNLPGRSTYSLNAEAVRHALNDAGIPKDRVDGLFVKFPTSRFEFMYGQKLAETLGIVPRIGGVWDQGGAANASMVGYAAMAIAAGQCDVAVVTFADNPKSGTRQAYDKAWGHDQIYGWFGIPAGYAMIAQRHMGQYGTTAEQLGAISVTCRTNGARNPRAQLQKPLTLADYMDSPMIVEPLRRDDCCLVSDGGAAVVLTSAEFARREGLDKTVPILGFGQGQTSWEVAQRPDLTTTAAKASAETAFAMAGLTPRDVDVAQIYDCFTITALMSLEDYGFCKPGQGGDFCASGAIALDGELPINTSGGLLSETGMPGMQLIIEGVRQMRGDAANQVSGARTCAISNQGGVMHTHATLILGQ